MALPAVDRIAPLPVRVSVLACVTSMAFCVASILPSTVIAAAFAEDRRSPLPLDCRLPAAAIATALSFCESTRMPKALAAALAALTEILPLTTISVFSRLVTSIPVVSPLPCESTLRSDLRLMLTKEKGVDIFA